MNTTTRDWLLFGWGWASAFAGVAFVSGDWGFGLLFAVLALVCVMAANVGKPA